MNLYTYACVGKYPHDTFTFLYAHDEKVPNGVGGVDDERQSQVRTCEPRHVPLSYRCPAPIPFVENRQFGA
jgi:hypothetical protein